ncbi:very short patch repair endonuclease [Streptomyces sp. NBRC 13847]|uniref:very short patch repair endonuclease n=1 Tax=Streptomyces sp. NBRC 13847 TaxID=3030991 RepID=UPI002556801E|nr:very short patch repair endonuclease [Streptomyces sp. NBRC 13847]
MPRDANVRRVMSAQRSRDTVPELALRRALHALGFRYRVDLPLPGMRRRRSDLTFVRWRTAVFVQGCFWHACPEHLHAPMHNGDWWREKLEGNVRRDADTDARLVRLGWVPLRIWEHETVDAAVGRVVEVLGSRGHPRALRILSEAVRK